MRIIDDKFLTRREKEVVLHILSGKNKTEIADILSVSVSTIKANVENIYRKFDVHNKVQLIIYLVKNGLVDLYDKDSVE